jgi:hypothetical protein
MPASGEPISLHVDVGCPPCSRCGALTRIYGVEPHSQYDKTDIRTYVCDGCETIEVRIIPALAG